ncbi:pca operon transcription factor PcaQ [Georhizobium sp. MAB10]|uniref:pca operon transcription factor PcaQ n=1 Tax=Georhizobium sp. MAB10 TaxID=3028319 RepID=UPI0038556EAA
MDQQIKFRHLQTFMEVARQKSVSKAADVLALTQPAVTRTIRELEDALGVRLFEKDGRGIRISRFGEVFLRHAGSSVAALRQGVDSIQQALRSEGPPVRIGALPTVSARIMPDAVAQFLKENTGSPITVVTGDNSVLLEQLRTGALDLVVGRLAPPEMMIGLSFEPLYSEHVIFAVRSGHPLMSKPNFSLGELRDYTILMPTPNAVIRPFVDRFLVTNGIAELPVRIETVSDAFGRAYIRAHDAIWIISEGAVANDIRDGRVARLPIDTSETVGSVGLTTRGTGDQSLALSIFMQSVRAVARQTADG